jgi:tetratricopeptide (TPR) repeat protein
MHTIFYSWQSDIKPAANRTLIEDALELAIRKIHDAEGEPVINPAIDRDTAGVPGMPDISATILEKIDNSSVVVADVTLVDDGSLGRRFPNPNVLIEVGYAIKSLGFSRVLLIQNTFNGGIEDLPFDIRGKRIMTYVSHPDDTSRAEQRRQLARRLRDALIAILPVLKDTVSMENAGPALDAGALHKEIADLYRASPDDLVSRVENIVKTVVSSSQTPPETRAYVINRAIETYRNHPKFSNEYLYQLINISLDIHPTSNAFFNKGLIAGRMGNPYDSIAAYMKAIEYGDPNPSLCYLNAGNRYRDMNDVKIALAFYEKSVQLNSKQSSAWFAGAQLFSQIGDAESAKRFYKGFLDWFSTLPEEHKNDSYRQQASLAAHYIEDH